MLILLDRHSGLPVYRQLVDQIRYRIASGALRAGDELPSTRALAAELGLNPMTVSKAYGLLEREGALERRPGLSLVVSRRAEVELRREKLEEARRALHPAVRAVRQLGLGREEAQELFEELYDGADGNEEPGAAGSTEERP